MAFIILAGALVAFLPAQEAQPANNLNFQLVPPDQMPFSGTFYSWQRQWMPPWPYDPWPELPLYDLGGGYYLVDDREVDYDALAQLNRLLTLEGGEGGAQMQAAGTAADYGCALFLDITRTGSNAVVVGLHNTRAGQGYAIESTENLGNPSTWTTATNVTASGDSIEVLIAVEQGKHKFFRASDDRDYVVITNFTGLGFSNTLVYIPDSMGAVGPNHFVELLNGFSTNSAIVAYDKSGNVVAKTNVIDFFRIGTNYPTGNTMVDPRILYDQESGRWVATALDAYGSSKQVILAVSNTNSPTNLVANWTRYLLTVHGRASFTDFPTLGLDDNGLYVSVLQSNSGTNSGHTILAIKKPEIYQGTFIAQKFEITNSPLVWAIQPVVNFDPVDTNDFAWFVAKGPPDLGTSYKGGALLYRRLQWSGTNAFLDTTWFEITNVSATYRDYYDLDGTNISVLPAAGTGVGAPQTNGNLIDLHVPGSRLGVTFIRNGVLWTCQAVGLNGTNASYTGNYSATNVTRTGVQWIEASVSPSAGSLLYIDHGRVYDASPSNPFFYYFPSLMVNCAGDMVTGFSGSSATNHVGAYYSVRLSNGVVMDRPRVLRPGLTNFTYPGSVRWGDYSATTLDPNDDWAFWTVQQYADPAGADEAGIYPWKTVIVEIKPLH